MREEKKKQAASVAGRFLFLHSTFNEQPRGRGGKETEGGRGGKEMGKSEEDNGKETRRGRKRMGRLGKSGGCRVMRKGGLTRKEGARRRGRVEGNRRGKKARRRE